MDNKLQELTNRLYEEGLSKGRAEAEALLAEAKNQASKIVAEAEAEAKMIADRAKKDAEELQQNTMTEIALAGRQSIAKLKEAISEMIITKASTGQVAEANLDAQFVKDILVAVAQNWQGSSSDKVDLKALLPSDKEAALGKAFEDSVKSAMGGGLEISYSDGVKSGFRIKPKDGGFYISFTDSDFDTLLGEYLRPKVSEILYK